MQAIVALCDLYSRHVQPTGHMQPWVTGNAVPEDHKLLTLCDF